MSSAGIKIATTTTPSALSVAAVAEDADSNGKIAGSECALFTNNVNEDSPFCTLPALKDLQSASSYKELQHSKVPLENCERTIRNLTENEVDNLHTTVSNRDLTEFPKSHVKQGEDENTSVTQLSPGLSLLQQTAAASSPPPHSYRHSRAYRHFKNPPQPHMCIRTTTDAGEELFINVLSWTRIVIPQEPSDPIPLYGGMRVPPGSPRSPPIVFAVMANPEVLKDSGRHSKDPEERRAMVELMCDFVEAMNPGVKLIRNAVILKDRDISGELKDVWNAVQAQRDREREEQMLLQRQQHQQHFHNITNASTNGNLISNPSMTSSNNTSANTTTTTQQISSKHFRSGTGDDTMSMTVDSGTPPSSRKVTQEVQIDNNASNIDVERELETTKINNGQVSLALVAEHLDNKMLMIGGEQSEECSAKQQNTLTNNSLNNGNNSKDSLNIESGEKVDTNNQIRDLMELQPTIPNGFLTSCNKIEVVNESKTITGTSTPNAIISIPAQNIPTSISASPTAQPASTKKDKLGGFLPNGCIFPRFTKNNKHKDKDKDKEHKPKDKEKNVLLSALKKSKDKKSNTTAVAVAVAAATVGNSDEKITSSNSYATAANCNQTNNKQQKNCLQQLEYGVQKLDLNNHHKHTHINNSAIAIKNNTSSTNKNTTSTTNSTGGVSVH